MKITTETRQLSFADIQEKTKKRYEQILDRLDKPKTAKEIAVELFELGLIPSTERNYTAPRLTELEKMGYVKATDKKKCEYTGKTVAVYEKVEGGNTMEEKLLEIARLMNNFSKEYGCVIDIETYESKYIDSKDIKIIYRLRAIKPEQILLETSN